MNTFLLLVIALAVTGTWGIFFLREIFVMMIAVALAVFYAALFLFAPTIIDATKNMLIIAMMVGAVLSLILGRRRKI
jgi:hypothetical protein